MQVANEVYDVLFTVAQLRNEEANLERIKALTARNVALAEAGRQSDIQVDQSRQDELRSENRLLQLRAQLQGRYDRFCLFLGVPIDPRLRIDEGVLDDLTEVDELFPRIYELEEPLAIDRALEARLDFQNTRDNLVDRERKAEIAADALRAGLDFNAGINASSATDAPLSFSGGDAAWSAGLAFDLPVNRIPERNAYRNAIILAEVARRDVEQQNDQITTDVRAALRNMRQLAESYEIQLGATVLAERRVESAQLSLEAGRASTRDLLESQNALLNANNSATRALIDLTLARLDLYLELEVLRVEESGITLETEPLELLLPEGVAMAAGVKTPLGGAEPEETVR